MQTAAVINFAGGVMIRRGQPPLNARRPQHPSVEICGSNEKRVQAAASTRSPGHCPASRLHWHTPVLANPHHRDGGGGGLRMYCQRKRRPRSIDRRTEKPSLTKHLELEGPGYQGTL